MMWLWPLSICFHISSLRMKFGSLFCQVHFILILYNPCFLCTSDFTCCVVWQIGTNILEESFLGYVDMEVGG